MVGSLVVVKVCLIVAVRVGVILVVVVVSFRRCVHCGRCCCRGCDAVVLLLWLPSRVRCYGC